MQQLDQESETLKVSSREFVEAIADIEARANNNSADEFVSIEEALSSISMDIPAEEVMAVIRAKRAEAAQRSNQKQLRKRKMVGRALVWLLFVSILTNLVLIGAINHLREHPIESSMSLPAATQIIESMPQSTTPVKEVPNSAVEMEDGNVHIVPGKSGLVRFARSFAQPPNVEITNLGTSKTRIVEITKEGFTWENTGPDEAATPGDYRWTASGTR
jgi:hypothetical protein